MRRWEGAWGKAAGSRFGPKGRSGKAENSVEMKREVRAGPLFYVRLIVLFPMDYSMDLAAISRSSSLCLRMAWYSSSVIFSMVIPVKP